MPELTPKQARFVDAYMIDPNATKAAVAAGTTAKRADQAGYEFLSNPEIKVEIARRQKIMAEKQEITAERVLAEIANMAFYDVGDILLDKPEDEITEAEAPNAASYIVNGRYVMGLNGPADIKRLPEKLRRAIVGWGWDRNQNFTVKLADKSKALDQLARHLSLYNDKLEVTGLGALADRMERAAKRDG